jgi:hypothetical protein
MSRFFPKTVIFIVFCAQRRWFLPSVFCLLPSDFWLRGKRIPLEHIRRESPFIDVEAMTSGGTIMDLSFELKNLDKE